MGRAGTRGVLPKKDYLGDEGGLGGRARPMLPHLPRTKRGPKV